MSRIVFQQRRASLSFLPLLLLVLLLLSSLSNAFFFPLPSLSSHTVAVQGRQAATYTHTHTHTPRVALTRRAAGKDEDADLSAEFARRLEEDDEDALPVVPRRRTAPPPPAGAGIPQKGVAQRSLSSLGSLPKTQSYNKEDGTDYWMDEKTVKAEQRKKAKRKAPSPDQFPADKIRDEIVSPYKNNWILFISITIFSIAFFAFLFPEELQIPSIRIPDFETGADIPVQIK